MPSGLLHPFLAVVLGYPLLGVVPCGWPARPAAAVSSRSSIPHGGPGPMPIFAASGWPAGWWAFVAVSPWWWSSPTKKHASGVHQVAPPAALCLRWALIGTTVASWRFLAARKADLTALPSLSSVGLCGWIALGCQPECCSSRRTIRSSRPLANRILGRCRPDRPDACFRWPAAREIHKPPCH